MNGNIVAKVLRCNLSQLTLTKIPEKTISCFLNKLQDISGVFAAALASSRIEFENDGWLIGSNRIAAALQDVTLEAFNIHLNEINLR